MYSYQTYSDHELAFLLKQGDERAFTEIYNRFFGLLLIHAVKRLHDEDEAKDVVQQLFEALWSKRHQINPEENLSAYLYASIRNRILDIFSHQKVAGKYMDSLKGFLQNYSAPTDYRVREKELSLLIEREINALPPKMREIFTLSRKNHKSHKEIAEKLGLSELTVKTQVKNALKILRKRIGLLLYVSVLFKIYS